MNKPSVILLGSKPGSVVALELMIKQNWNIEAVIPSGKHEFIKSQTLKDVANQNGIKIEYNMDALDKEVDYVISYMYRHRVPKEILSLAKIAALNFHAAPLPEFGGWAFYNIAILEDVEEYGCTCHHMDEGFDTGPILKVNKFKIDASQETAFSLERKAQKEMIKLFSEFMELAMSNTLLPKNEQKTNKMRYLNKKEFEIMKEISIDSDYTTAQKIARAFFYPPYQGAYIKINNNKFEIIPDCIKSNIAEKLHENHLQELRDCVEL